MNYYDDAIAYTAAGLGSHWARSLVSAEAKIYSTNLGSVGVGTDNPGAKLAVVNNFSAESTVAAVQYCNPTDADCLDPNTIAGTGMKCADPMQVADGTEMDTGTGEQVLRCKDLFTNLPVFTCPAGEYLVAFSNLGNYVCDTYP
jgi:hypothetical protein